MIFDAFSLIPSDEHPGSAVAETNGMHANHLFIPLSRSSSYVAKLSPVMISSVALLAVSTGLVLTSPQRIPAWCALGAAIATVFTIYFARKNDKTPMYLVVVALASMLLGVAAPRPTLQYLGFTNLEAYYPEWYVLGGCACGIAGFTVIHGLYLGVTGQLPDAIRAFFQYFIDKFKPRPPAAP